MSPLKLNMKTMECIECKKQIKTWERYIVCNDCNEIYCDMHSYNVDESDESNERMITMHLCQKCALIHFKRFVKKHHDKYYVLDNKDVWKVDGPTIIYISGNTKEKAIDWGNGYFDMTPRISKDINQIYKKMEKIILDVIGDESIRINHKEIMRLTAPPGSKGGGAG